MYTYAHKVIHAPVCVCVHVCTCLHAWCICICRSASLLCIMTTLSPIFSLIFCTAHSLQGIRHPLHQVSVPGDGALTRVQGVEVSGGSGRPPHGAGGWAGSVTLHPDPSPLHFQTQTGSRRPPAPVPEALPTWLRTAGRTRRVLARPCCCPTRPPCLHAEPLLVTSTGGVTTRQPLSQKQVASQSPFGLTRDSVPPNVPHICRVVISPSVEVSVSLEC